MYVMVYASSFILPYYCKKKIILKKSLEIDNTPFPLSTIFFVCNELSLEFYSIAEHLVRFLI